MATILIDRALRHSTAAAEHADIVVAGLPAVPGAIADLEKPGNQLALLPHTEGNDLNGYPSRYLARWCIVPPSGEGGETTLLDGYRLVNALTGEEREALHERTYQWNIADRLRRRGMSYEAEPPVPEDVDGTVLLRFSCDNVRVPDDGDDTIRAFVERGKALFGQQHIQVRCHRNDLLHWDNWRILHVRTAFDDSRRHLKRVQIRYRSPRAA